MIKLFDKPSKELTVNPDDQKANEINLIQGKRPYMRAFHFSWLSFHIAFTGWFAIAPLLPYIVEDLKLTSEETEDGNIVNVAAAVFFRFLVGPLCDRFGPKRVMALLLILGSIPVGLSALVHTPLGLIIVRFFIGILGATFVPCQFWTTQMFSKNIVGSANALVGGWGNMGAGITTIFMALIAAGFVSAGLSPSLSWRVSLVIPAVLCFTVGLCDYFFTDDCPQGDWLKRGLPSKPTAEVHVATHDEKKTEVNDSDKADKVVTDTDSERNVPAPDTPKRDLKTFLLALKDPNVLLLMIMYACCFGVELAVDGALTLFFYKQKHFNLTKKNAGLIASLFGLMNLFSRATGGFISDYANEKMGVRGRILSQFIVLLLEGLFLFVFPYTLNSLAEAIVILILFSYFTQVRNY
jgi:NNP family nitrate/nitrite transporter-like MFS transporter